MIGILTSRRRAPWLLAVSAPAMPAGLALSSAGQAYTAGGQRKLIDR
jgi:hypothetical protein